MTDSDRRAVVVGAGIGGLTAAIELQRAGFEVTVFERRPELGEVNTGFLLWALAIKRLRALGLGPGVDRIGEPLTRVVTSSHRGKVLSDLSLEKVNRRIGAPSYDVHRAGLQTLLADAAGRDSIELGDGCAAVEGSPERPAVVLESGRSVESDLVVVADGVNSTLRRAIVGEVGLKRDDIGVWRGVAEVDQTAVPAGHHLRFHGPQGLFGCGRLDERQVRWYAGGPIPEGGGAAERSQVEERFGSWADPTGEVIAATPDEAFLFNDTPRARPLRRWVRGAVALLGDAAHPTLPALASGGGLAIEDAAVLGECARGQDDLSAALSCYERRRRPLASRIQRESAAFGRLLELRSRPARWVRDLGLRVDWIQRMEIVHLMRGGALRA